MKKLKDNWIFELSITTILLGLMCYAAYSLWYIFDGTLSSGDIHLYTALTSVALGWFMMMFTKTIFKKANWIVKLVTFLVGCGLFQGLIWGINAKMNPVMNKYYYIEQLKEKYPKVNKEDLYYICLILLNVDLNKLQYLLDRNPKTVWYRLNKIKSMMGLEAGDDIMMYLMKNFIR
mgnify:CR=1 FL=1